MVKKEVHELVDIVSQGERNIVVAYLNKQVGTIGGDMVK